MPLRSRLYEMCKKVKIEGEDYRKRLDQRRFDTAVRPRARLRRSMVNEIQTFIDELF